MYRNYNKIIYIADFVLVILIVVSFVTCQNVDVKTNTLVMENKTLNLYLDSAYLEKEVVIEEKQVKEEDKKEISTSQNKASDKIMDKTKENPVKKTKEEKEQTNNEKTIETLTGSLAGYGPDCYGCTSKRTASGRYIGEGNIYYQDKEYGKVRIVAGDKKYPFGTIVKMSNTKYYDNAPIIAIVLDRGGGVGIGKKFLFDLLFSTEKEAAKIGSTKNVTFEILRFGY